MRLSWLGIAALCVSAAAQDVPFGISRELVQFVTPKDNPTTAERIELGRKLFHDKRLSADNTVSCATCHDPEAGFTARIATAKGIKDQIGKRNSPTVLNAMFMTTQFWDGRAPTLEDQATLPILNPIEMGMKDGNQVVAKLAAIPEYKAEFRKVFGREVNYPDVGRAIAAFERTIVSGNAPIDHFLAGKEDALSAAQRRGWSLFNGKARCNSCHGFNQTQSFFTDNLFHNVGIAAAKQDFVKLASRAEKAVNSGNLEEVDRMALETDFSELGRFLVTKNRADIGAFKTPQLRDIVITGPYMHDGSLKTLWDVMDHYNKGGVPNPFLDGGIQRLGLTEEEINDLVELMNAFTSSRFAQQAKAELEQQRATARNSRPERDTDAAMGKKMGRGDAVPDSGSKDPALLGGRPVSK